MRIKKLYFMIIVLFLITGCNGEGDNKEDVFVTSRYFTFEVAIVPTSLTQENSFSIYSPVTEIVASPEAYSIEDNEDLVVFNQTHIRNPDEYLALNDLNAFTYFLIRDPGCPDYFDYSHHSYNNNQLTLTLDHFHETDVACPAVILELYVVFKVRKSP